MSKAVSPSNIVSRQARRDAWEVLHDLGVRSLLSEPDANPKIAKNMKRGVLTAPLHLAPAKLSGFEVCPMRTQGCTRACLHTAGNPAHMAQKRSVRIARTRAYFKARCAFMIALAADIEAQQREADRQGMLCGVRLNATSDIPWEAIGVPPLHHYYGEVSRGMEWRTHANLMRIFPRVRFYDYTKRPNRWHRLPCNYRLTFSLAENNELDAIAALQARHNVAVVFNVPPGKPLPRHYMLGVGTLDLPHTFRVIDGDLHDFRPIDPRGVIVGLRAKGKARRDKSGFVRQVV